MAANRCLICEGKMVRPYIYNRDKKEPEPNTNDGFCTRLTVNGEQRELWLHHECVALLLLSVLGFERASVVFDNEQT